MITVQEASKLLNVSPDTIRRWEKKKLIKGTRSSQGYRLFDPEELKRVQNKYSNSDSGVLLKVLKAKKTNYTVMELFSGCGGMALGFENAGLKSKRYDSNSTEPPRSQFAVNYLLNVGLCLGNGNIWEKSKEKSQNREFYVVEC